MRTKISRRDFLKIAGLSMAALAFRPYYEHGEAVDDGALARVAVYSVSVHKQPSDDSQIVHQRYRDELLHVYEEVVSPDGPCWNPVWYRVWGGYVHSGYLQKVQTRFNPVASKLKAERQLARVTVPFSQAMFYTEVAGWQQVYRLYYDSVHWVTGIDEGPDGAPWYQVWDELLNLKYFVPAPHLSMIDAAEYAPITPDVPHGKKWIHVSISRQELTAYENDQVVLLTKCSTGLPSRNLPPGAIPTETPKGSFHIQNKMPVRHMGDGNLTADPEAYELPGVPWVSYFEPETGVAIHGTYWHQNYGVQMSHGCVNLKPEEALWVFRWATPAYVEGDVYRVGYGTSVIVE